MIYAYNRSNNKLKAKLSDFLRKDERKPNDIILFISVIFRRVVAFRATDENKTSLIILFTVYQNLVNGRPCEMFLKIPTLISKAL